MYKDVKKKLLSVALCVCMIIGMVQVVPRAKAQSSTTQTVTATEIGNPDVTATFTLTLSGVNRKYDGEEQLPTIANWTCTVSDGRPLVYKGHENEIWLQKPADSAKQINASATPYTCEVRSNKWAFEGQTIQYTIEKAEITGGFVVTLGSAQVQHYTGSTIMPKADDIVVTATVNGVFDKKIKSDQYEVLGTGDNTESGSKNCIVKLSDENYQLSNNVNYEKTIPYVIAYDIGTDLCPVELDPSEIDYGSSMTMPMITLYPGGKSSGKPSVAVTNNTNFSITYNDKEEEPTSAGTYTVKVKPVAGKDATCTVDGFVFTGEGEASESLKINAMGSTGLRVWARDPQTGQDVELSRAQGGKTLSLPYSANDSLRPTITKIAIDENGEDYKDYCTVTYPRPAAIGQVEIVITPDPTKTNYEGSWSVYYNITSAINVESYQFDGADSSGKIEYDGNVHKLVNNDCVVKNAAGELLGSGDYTIKYQYYNGQDYVDVTDEQKQLSTVGKKRALIIGKAVYKDYPSIPLDYEITPVDISKGTIKVTFAAGETYSYTGEPIVPTPTAVTYNGKLIDNFDDEFEFRCNKDTNVNAGEVTMFVRGKNVNYKGENQVKFTINKLDMDYAEVDPKSYEYARRGIAPTIKIGTYTLKPTDYTTLYYDGDMTQKKAPENVGDHSVTIHVGSTNIECKGVQEREYSYKITKRSIYETDVQLTGVDTQGALPSIEWNGEKTHPGVIVGGSSDWEEDTDYEVRFVNDDTVSLTTPAAVVVTGKGNYTGSVQIPYEITARNLSAEGVKHEVTVSPAEDELGQKPPYTATVKIKDLNDSSLVNETDYKLKEIWYWDGVLIDDKSDASPKENWKKLEGSKYASVLKDGNLEITLGEAGKYRAVLGGNARYKEERTVEFTCGKDISGYWAHIDDYLQTEFTFNGKEQTPNTFSLYRTYTQSSSGNTVDELVDDISYQNGDFTVSYIRFDGGTKVTQAVGDRIYVIAKGTPGNGYYGQTKHVPDKQYNYYKITAVEWTDDNFTVTGTAVEYLPKGRTKVPTITVTCNGEVLQRGRDYELEDVYLPDGTINPALQTAGRHTIYIVGIGNYKSTNGNREPYRYDVPKVDISDEKKIYCDVTEASFNNIESGTITLWQDDYELLEGSSSDPNKGDYTKNRVSSIESDGSGKYYVTYELTGSGKNYTGTRIVKVAVVKADLSTIKGSEQEAGVGEFFVAWIPSELLIQDPKNPQQVTPENFEIGYKVSEKQTLTLKKDTDYEIVEYGNNNQAGQKPTNWVRIRGKDGGGYIGSCELPITLYTDMTQAEPTDASLIKDGATIKKSAWKNLYKGSTDVLLELKPLWTSNEPVHIDPNEYELTWTAGLDLENPVAGTYKVTVNGLQKEKNYYYGGKTFEFTIVDDIEGAQITVGKNNTVLYQGEDKPILVTAAGIGITVTVDGNPLTLGTDYEIIECFDNAAIGEATLKLRGKGKYTGEVPHHFKITYPISKLIVFVEDPDNNWVDTRSGTVQYRYTGNPVEPAVKLYCPVDFPSNATADDYLAAEPLSSTMYDATEFLNNTNAGKATIVINNAPYFTDGSADPRRYVVFQIGTASIRPPADGGNVTYESSNYPDVNNMIVDYMGENYEVDKDFGITLRDGTLKLNENEHYKVYFDGDRKNVSDSEHKPVIHFSGLGNYEGSEHEISFEIRERSINDVSAQDVELVYTDGAREQQIIDKIKLVLNTPRDREQNLVFGTDYTIEKYYMDAGCTKDLPVDKGIVSESGRLIPSVPGDYYVKVKGKGNFKDERAIHITIVKRDLTDNIKITFIPSMDSDCAVVDGIPDCVYNGKEHRPAVEITYGVDSIKLIENRDYTLAYDNNVNAGDAARVTVTMIDQSNYQGSAERLFTIKQKDIAGEDMRYLDKNGKTFEDEAAYEWKGTGLPVHPTNFGKISDISMSADEMDLEENTDYTIEYDDNNNDDHKQINAGKVTMTFKGQGNYGGEKVFTYYIGEDISRAYTLVNGKRSLSVEYNGLAQAPKENAISVEISGSDKLDLIAPDGEKRYAIQYFKEGFEYEDRVKAEDFVNAGTYYVAVVGVPELGTYAKSSEQNSCTYKINQRSISPSYVLVSGYDATYYYVGSAIEPQGITVEDTDLPVAGEESGSRKRTVKLIPGIDYDLNYRNNTMAGKASIVVTGKGNYTGERVAYFNILSSSADGNNTWDGSSEGSGSISNGTTSIAASDIILGYDNSDYNCMMYTGYERTPTVTINGISTNEFTITASNNIRPGIATLMITGNGSNFTGTIIKKYKIKANLAAYGSIAAIEDQVYTGYQITPHVTLTCGGNVLNQGSDYTLTYLNNTSVGKATVMATATNDSNYIGTASGSFNISNTAGGMEITGYASTYTYTGYAITPDIVVTMSGRVLNRGTDYTVSYSNNTNVGTATMTVTGIGSFSGTKTINYTIEAKNIENCLTTAVDDYQYTGSTYTPNISVTDSSTGKTLIAGTDYTITYSNNTNPGTASITVTALSKNYSGSKVIPFKIFSAAVSGLRVSSIKNNSMKLSWTPQDYADGYQICNSSNRVIATTSKNSYTIKRLTSCTTYRYKVRSYVENADGSVSYGNFSTAVSAKTLLNTPKLKAKSTSRGRVTLTWSKVSKASGYEIYYSTKKNGVYTRLKTVSKSSSRKFVDKGLASGEKYYYTIRAYRTTNGVKTYSSYNTIKSVKVK